MEIVTFENKSFCFTGGLAELKRTQAEREVRARKGFSQKVINKELDFLVLGSIPSPGWKHGDYGNKTHRALELINDGAKLKIISENDFMESLENYVPIGSGEINDKLLICRYKSLFQNGELDIEALELFLKLVNETANSHVTATIEEPYIYKELYNEFSEENLENLLFFQCRIVKQFVLEASCQEFVDTIAIGFEGIKGLDGDISWSEKKEGSASFAKLLQDIPIRTTLIS